MSFRRALLAPFPTPPCFAVSCLVRRLVPHAAVSFRRALLAPFPTPPCYAVSCLVPRAAVSFRRALLAPFAESSRFVVPIYALPTAFITFIVTDQARLIVRYSSLSLLYSCGTKPSKITLSANSFALTSSLSEVIVHAKTGRPPRFFCARGSPVCR